MYYSSIHQPQPRADDLENDMTHIIKFTACGQPGAVHWDVTPNGDDIVRVFWGGAGVSLDSLDESCMIKRAAEFAIEVSA